MMWTKKRSKFGAIKTNGYDSQKESKRAWQLYQLQSAGEIKDLKEQVRYELIPSQKGKDGKVIERPCSYIADFVYSDRYGNITVEDCKGFKTPEYKIKKKLMLFKYHIKIKET